MYNNFPIKNVDLGNSANYVQVESEGVVVTSAVNTTTINSNSMTISHGGSSFKYCPKLILSSSMILPTPVLPYQEIFGINSNRAPVSFWVPNGYTMFYDGNSYTRVTLGSLGQTITFSIINTVYYVVCISGTIGFGQPNVVFN